MKTTKCIFTCTLMALAILFSGCKSNKDIYTQHDSGLTQENNENVNTDLTTGEKSYTVQKGDTLWSISKRFNCPVDSLVKTNGIEDKHIISVGQALIIPGK